MHCTAHTLTLCSVRVWHLSTENIYIYMYIHVFQLHVCSCTVYMYKYVHVHMGWWMWRLGMVMNVISHGYWTEECSHGPETGFKWIHCPIQTGRTEHQSHDLLTLTTGTRLHHHPSTHTHTHTHTHICTCTCIIHIRTCTCIFMVELRTTPDTRSRDNLCRGVHVRMWRERFKSQTQDNSFFSTFFADNNYE